MEEVRRVQAFRTAWAVGGPEKAALLTELHLGMTTMAVYAAECPLVGQFPPALACDAVLTVPQSTSYTSFGSISKQYRRRVASRQHLANYCPSIPRVVLEDHAFSITPILNGARNHLRGSKKAYSCVHGYIISSFS
jgi:hypothetical protein